MSSCDGCGQEKPVTDAEVLAIRMDAYVSAFQMFRDLYKRDPEPYEAELTARFLAADEQPVIMTEGACGGEGGDE